MATVRSILKTAGIHPRKGLGQCFLEDRNIMQKIVAVAGVHADDRVVEIGAGIGILTEMLAAEAGSVVAIDVDPRMTTILRERLHHEPRIEIIERDVLTCDFSVIAGSQPTPKLKIIGNIPYYLSTPILFHLLMYRREIHSMTLMFQKEVVDRLVADPGSKEYGIPSVIVAMFALPCKEMNVPATCFYPQPRVESAVIKIVMREKPRVQLTDELFFVKMVKIAFAMRRKTLQNNLRAAALPVTADHDIESLLQTAGIEGGRRGETLTPEEFGRLSNVFYAALH